MFFSGKNKLLTSPNVLHTTNLHPDGECCFLCSKPSLGKEVHTYTCITSFTAEPGIWVGRSAVAYLAGPRYFSVLRNVQTYSGADPASFSMETGKSFPWVKWHGREAGHSHPSSPVVKITWCCNSMCLHSVHMDNFTFTTVQYSRPVLAQALLSGQPYCANTVPRLAV